MSDADPDALPPPDPTPVHCAFPVPPIGLGCPHCRYDLTGLTETRCPECGEAFDLDALFDTGVRLNGAVRLAMLRNMLGEKFGAVERSAGALALRTGTTIMSAIGILAQDYLDQTLDREPSPGNFQCFYDEIAKIDRLLAPLPRPPRRADEFDCPDTDYPCANCGKLLIDVRKWTCSHCGRAVAPADLLPGHTLIALNREIGRNQTLPVLLMRTALESEGIPNDAQSSAGSAMSTIGGVELSALRVARSYTFDALAFLAEVREQYGTDDDEENANDWTCDACGEQAPGNFELCWNCSAPRP